jgi:large subunit ribosomal protein L4e
MPAKKVVKKVSEKVDGKAPASKKPASSKSGIAGSGNSLLTSETSRESRGRSSLRTKGSAAKKALKPKSKPMVSSIKVKLYSKDGKSSKNVSLPIAFEEEVRLDLIHRAFKAHRANKRQPYGSNPVAGLMHSVEWPGKGRGSARTPRMMNGRFGAEAPNTPGGRRAHPPKVEKKYSQKVNKKEARKAFRSALACTAMPEYVNGRGHKFDDKLTLPVIVEKKFEDIEKTADVVEALQKLGIYEDIIRSQNGRNIRAGKGTMRNRKYQQPKGPLFVVSDFKKGKALRNLAGVDVVTPNHITIEHLAPGGQPGRLTIITEKAVKILEGW